MTSTTKLLYGQDLKELELEMNAAFWPPASTAVILPDSYAGPDVIFQGTFWGLKTSGKAVRNSETKKNLVTIDPAQLYNARQAGAKPRRPDARITAKNAVKMWGQDVGIIRIDIELSAQTNRRKKQVRVIKTKSGRRDLLLHIDRGNLHQIVRDDFAELLLRLCPQHV
jgi:hypothetical protein